MTKEEFANAIGAARADIADLIGTRDSGAQLLRVLTLNVAPSDVVKPGGDEVWHWCGQYLSVDGRVHEALGLLLKLYEMKLSAQRELKTRAHKGSDLILISYCFSTLGFAAHAKRYAMLAMCEDAVIGEGTVSPEGGAYFQLTWVRGVSEKELSSYGKSVFQFYKKTPEAGMYSEALLQSLGERLG